MMKISFIIPVYNCKEYLSACVDSIRAVNAENYEILLIDDGSTDGSSGLCDQLSEKMSEIRVFHQENAGVSSARNRGIQEATGDWLLFIDADDSVDSAALRAILSESLFQETDMTIFGISMDYYHKGSCYRSDDLYYDFEGVMDRNLWGGALLQLFRSNSLSSMCNKVFRRELIQRNDLLLNTSMFLYEDLEFVLRYMQNCNRIWNVPQTIYHYRQSEGEGHTRHRLKRIDSIGIFLTQIESALRGLPENVGEEARAAMLQLLYVILAQEKIAASGFNGIQEICRDYRLWAQGRCLPLGMDQFQRRLLEEKVAALYLAIKKSQLRHKVAVNVKSILRTLKGIGQS